MKTTFGFGKGTMSFEVPGKNYMGTLKTSEDGQVEFDEQGEVLRAITNPIDSEPLCEIVCKGKKVVIVTSDITRPLPTYKIMPTLLDQLYSAGVKKEDITLVFALGAHREHTKEEMLKLAGERAMNEVNVIDGDPSDCVHIGATSYGTPVDVVRVVAEADVRICMGNIEYHYFAGYSGGAKAIMPGVSTRDAIQANHSRMVNPEACAGAIDTNPLRLDIDEAGGMTGIDFIINVVLDEKKRIVKAFAGHYITAHREGCAFLDTMFLCEVGKRADIVVVSQGGYPKDLNLYQTQKALDNAKHAVAKDGIIILVGSCVEGLGEHVFEEWILNAPTASSMIDRVQNNFELGGHKAAAIAMVLENARIFLVSEMNAEFVKKIFLEPYSDIQSALDEALKIKGEDATVLLMPYGGSTLPKVSE